MCKVHNLSKTTCRLLSKNHMTCQTEIGSYLFLFKYEVLNLSKTACRFLSKNHMTCQTEIGSYVQGT